MKYLAKLVITLVLALLLGAVFDGAHAEAKATGKRARITKASFRGGDALKPKKSLQFDGRSVESMRSGQYDSYSHLGGNGESGARRLYSLPANFQSRAADSEMEMRYRP